MEGFLHVQSVICHVAQNDIPSQNFQKHLTKVKKRRNWTRKTLEAYLVQFLRQSSPALPFLFPVTSKKSCSGPGA